MPDGSAPGLGANGGERPFTSPPSGTAHNTLRSRARRLLDLIGKAGLPTPRTNAKVGPYEVDILWPEHRLVIEVDGYATRHDKAFERDRARDAHLTALGHRVMRVTWRQIVAELEVIARLAGALATP